MRSLSLTFAILITLSCAGGGSSSDVVADTDAADVAADTPPIDEGLPPIDIPPPTKEPQWTLDNTVPSVVAGKTMRYFSGYESFGQRRLYFCGDGGVFRVAVDGQWLDQDISSSATIQACHAVGDDLMVAVGDDGKFWSWMGSDNWLSDDIIDTSPGLRGVWITTATSVTVVGVAGSIYRYDGADWENQTIPDTSGTLSAVWGTSANNLYAVGDKLLLHYNGTEWLSETMPEDPPGTPEANMGISARAVAGSDADHVWAVGDQGKVAFRDAAGVWAYQDAQWYATPFQGVWAGQANFALAVSAKGNVRQFDGTTWQIVDVATPKKTLTGEKWPPEQVVPKGPTLDYVGAYAVDETHIWLFDKTGKLLQYNMNY